MISSKRRFRCCVCKVVSRSCSRRARSACHSCVAVAGEKVFSVVVVVVDIIIIVRVIIIIRVIIVTVVIKMIGGTATSEAFLMLLKI